ncbi:MAG: isoleucine--tRNA ligase [Candidatus ainarchaeum sp.]|nr:isoleucine--tRNA ligase [Candidatus ainarchaeum sp.]
MYRPSEVEGRVSGFWEREGIFEKVKAADKGRQKFYFPDGPPYATGDIHPGTAWNKALKDAVYRYKRMRGFKVNTIPCFDSHGLPIEEKVERSLKFKSKKDIEDYGVERFIEKCKEYSTKYIGTMSGDFKSLGVWMDWDGADITFRDAFIERSWLTLRRAQEKKLLAKGFRVGPVCPRCETALANNEIEHAEQADPSVYLKFRVSGEDSTYLLVWTTTPWTLPANLLLMAHPEFTYVKVNVNGETWILAKERLGAVAAIADPFGLAPKVVEEFSGKKLEGMRYEQPLASEVPAHSSKELKKFHYVTLSKEHVTLEEGTGIVHTAPGHGPEDFEIGKREGAPAFSPVSIAGIYTRDAGKYAGMGVFDANEKVLGDLREKGLLLSVGRVTHSYPVCWRCKSPLIYIASEQWYIAMSSLREKMIAEAGRVKWQPPHAGVWFKNTVSNAPDWCISRQRYWGIPFPLWSCGKCGESELFASRAEIEERSGKKLSELHKPQLDAVTFACRKCKGEMKRIPDILDVWFDSGNMMWCTLGEEGMAEWYPADLVCEGKEQIKSWFYSLLACGMVRNGEVPYRALLMHGHMVAENGEKMSKSKGNFVPFRETIAKYGGDGFRLWALNSVVWDDLRSNEDELKDASRALGIFWNLHVYLLRAMEAEGFDPKAAAKEKPDYDLEDQWLVSRMNSTILQATKAMESYAVHEASRALRRFIVADLSRLYLKLAKKRLGDERNKKALLRALYDSLLSATRMAAPLVPFIAEEIYQNAFRKHEGAESVSMLAWPEHDPGAVNPALERQMEIAVDLASAAANARQSAGVNLRWPVAEAVVATQSTEVRGAVERLPFIIEMLANVKRLRIEDKPPTTVSFKVSANRLGAAFKQKAQKVRERLEAMRPEELRDALADGRFELAVENYKFPIVPDMVEFVETPPPGYALAPGPESKVLVKTEVAGELYAEGLRREVARRIQLMRKEMGLVEKDEIEATVCAPKEFLAILKTQKDELAREVHASKLHLSQKGGLPGTAKKWRIEDEDVEIALGKREPASGRT